MTQEQRAIALSVLLSGGVIVLMFYGFAHHLILTRLAFMFFGGFWLGGHITRLAKALCGVKP